MDVSAVVDGCSKGESEMAYTTCCPRDKTSLGVPVDISSSDVVVERTICFPMIVVYDGLKTHPSDGSETTSKGKYYEWTPSRS
jgi:hypothetical protein